VNEDEMQLMAADPMALAATALASGVHLLCVTLGRKGAAYFAAPGFSTLADIATPVGGGAFSAVSTALVPIEPSLLDSDPGDPTGCGDVWGATQLLAGTTFTDAMRLAHRAAARNVRHRGATGLAHYLRGELAPS
jgi:sugar/nucleoside kinase (ribokinase family)